MKLFIDVILKSIPDGNFEAAQTLAVWGGFF
jgi:hypothetical protein